MTFKLKKVVPLEKQIQKVILDYLTIRGVYCWKEHSSGMMVDGGKYFVQAGLKGKADILGIAKDGRFLAIEVKRPGGVLSPAQVEFLYNIKRNGGIAIVAYSLDDVIKEGL